MYFLYKPNGNLGLGATTSIEYSKATHFAMLHHLRGYLAKVIEKKSFNRSMRGRTTKHLRRYFFNCSLPDKVQ